MAEAGQFDRILSPVAAWARSRPDILGLAVLGPSSRRSAESDTDILLLFVVSEPQAYRYDDLWLAEINWRGDYVTGWRDADYGKLWSRHVRLSTPREVEFTFCAPSWAATDPVDEDTAHVVSNGCQIVLDKARLLERLLAVTAP